MTLKDGYRFGGFSGTPPSEPNLSPPPPPPRCVCVCVCVCVLGGGGAIIGRIAMGHSEWEYGECYFSFGENSNIFSVTPFINSKVLKKEDCHTWA